MNARNKIKMEKECRQSVMLSRRRTNFVVLKPHDVTDFLFYGRKFADFLCPCE